MTHVRYILAAFSAFGIVTFVVVAMWSPRPGVTQAKFDRIEYGMTKEEVESIFGTPPANTAFMGVVPGLDKETRLHFWTCPSGNSATIWIGSHGVFLKHWPEQDVTIIRKIHRWVFPELKMEASSGGIRQAR